MDARSSPHRRLAAALALSALAHLAGSMGIAPGSPGAASPNAPAFLAPVNARLVFPEPEAPRVAPAMPRETLERGAPALPRVQPREPVPQRAAKLPQAAAPGGADIPDPTYYPARQLDVYPTLVSPLDRSHFELPGGSDTQGRALLLVLIDAAGGVDEVTLVERGATAELEEAARRAFVAARFSPAQKNGRPVKSRVLIEVTFGTGGANRPD